MARLRRKEAQSYGLCTIRVKRSELWPKPALSWGRCTPHPDGGHREWIDVRKDASARLLRAKAGSGERVGARSLAGVVEQWGTSAQRAAVSQCRANELMVRHRYRDHRGRGAARANLEAWTRRPRSTAPSRASISASPACRAGRECARAAPLLERTPARRRLSGYTLYSRATTYLTIARRRLGDEPATRATRRSGADAATVARLRLCRWRGSLPRLV